jgi:GNAT superfamily N-acetyltransferase
LENAIDYRLATVTDAEELGEVHVASWRETYSGLVPDELIAGLCAEKRAQVWEQMLQRPENFGFPVVHLAVESGRVVGFGCSELQRHETMLSLDYDGDFSSIYVLAEAQRQGVGTRLIELMAADLKLRGCVSVGVWVLDRNKPARCFYERLGAVEVARKREERSTGTLVEVGYGWRDLLRLAPS